MCNGGDDRGLCVWERKFLDVVRFDVLVFGLFNVRVL